jgi:hypothetical protein
MGRSVLPNIEPRDIEFMEKVLSIGTKPHKFAIWVQAVLGRARSQSTNDLAMILGMNFGTPRKRLFASSWGARLFAHRFEGGGPGNQLIQKGFQGIRLDWCRFKNAKILKVRK